MKSNINEVKQVIGLLGDAFTQRVVSQISRASIMPVNGEMGMPIMREGHDLQTAAFNAFESEGRNQYQKSAWTGYESEPKYARYKSKRDGGSKVGIWQNSTNPLRDTFRVGHPENIYYVFGMTFRYGSSRGYAGTFHAGGPVQKWDMVPQPERHVLPPTDQFGREVARAYQNWMWQHLRAQGKSMKSVRVVL